MAVIGYGIDVVDVGRFEKAWRRFGDKLLRRIFSDDERDWCLSRRNPAIHLAARFGAKEAFVKAIGHRRGFRWKDVEIIPMKDGKPVLNLKGNAGENARKEGVRNVFVSLSHDGGLAVAGVILDSEHYERRI